MRIRAFPHFKMINEIRYLRDDSRAFPHLWVKNAAERPQVVQ